MVEHITDFQHYHHPVYGIAASMIVCPSCNGLMIVLPYAAFCLNGACGYIVPPLWYEVYPCISAANDKE